MSMLSINLKNYVLLFWFSALNKNFNEPKKKWATELNRTFLKEKIQMAKNT
jgi:hypothetical protein